MFETNTETEWRKFFKVDEKPKENKKWTWVFVFRPTVRDRWLPSSAGWLRRTRNTISTTYSGQTVWAYLSSWNWNQQDESSDQQDKPTSNKESDFQAECYQRFQNDEYDVAFGCDFGMKFTAGIVEYILDRGEVVTEKNLLLKSTTPCYETGEFMQKMRRCRIIMPTVIKVDRLRRQNLLKGKSSSLFEILFE